MASDSPARPEDNLSEVRSVQSFGTDEQRSWTSEELLGGQHEVFIRHGSETYRLRLTRQGKLILHK